MASHARESAPHFRGVVHPDDADLQRVALTRSERYSLPVIQPQYVISYLKMSNLRQRSNCEQSGLRCYVAPIQEMMILKIKTRIKAGPSEISV